MIYGYARVSSIDQNEARQIKALRDGGVDESNIYIDKESGITFNRNNYQSLLKSLQKDDVLIIKSIDRLGRNYEEVKEQWRFIVKEKNVNIKVIDMPLLDTTNNNDLITTFISDVVLQILSFVAETERINIKQRQKEGILIAKKNGIKFGRPILDTPKRFDKVASDYKAKKITIKEATTTLNMSQSTFYRRLNNINKQFS